MRPDLAARDVTHQQTSLSKRTGKGYLPENSPKSGIAAVTCAVATLPGLHPTVAQGQCCSARAQPSSPSLCLWPAWCHQGDSSPAFSRFPCCRSDGVLRARQAEISDQAQTPCGAPLAAGLGGPAVSVPSSAGNCVCVLLWAFENSVFQKNTQTRLLIFKVTPVRTLSCC